MARGDVIYVDLPIAGGAAREQSGSRPALAVQADNIDSTLPTMMIIPSTAQLAALRFPLTMEVKPSSMNGLTQQSVLLVFQLRAIDKRRIVRKLGTLESAYLQKIQQLMRQLLAI